MANYYTQMCAEIVPKTEEGRAWLTEQYKALQNLQTGLDQDGVDLSDEEVYQNVALKAAPTMDSAVLELVKWWRPLDTVEVPGFDLFVKHGTSVFNLDADADGGSVIFEDDGEYVEVERVADFLQLYLKKFEPAGRFGFEYAFTGDRHRPDTFGGGACFVTATHVRWMVSNDWLAKQKRAFDTRHERARPKRARPKKVVKTKKKR
jgi:hypothetical protein